MRRVQLKRPERKFRPSRTHGTPDLPLLVSVSSVETALNCEMKYVLGKVWHVEKDPDAPGTEKMDLGSAYHWILEETWHRRKDWTRELCMDAAEMWGLDRVRHGSFLGAATRKYYDLHERSGLETIAIEHEIVHKWFTGFIDFIAINRSDYWWIGDHKVKNWKEAYAVNLHEDLQLCSYTLFVDEIAKSLKLDPNKYVGALYRVAENSSLPKTIRHRPRNAEHLTEEEAELAAFDTSMRSIHMAVYQCEVPEKDMDLRWAWELLKLAREKMEFLWKNPKRACRNRQACLKYAGYQCQFWSQCHGGNLYSDGPIVRITNSETIRDMNGVRR